MVDISNIGKNLNLDATVAAGAAQAAGASNKGKLIRKRPVAEGKGLGLEDIPEQSSYVPVQDVAVEDAEEAGETEETIDTEAIYNEEENTQMLAKIDYELASLQALIKKALAKKIAVAAGTQDTEKQYKYLASAFEDCKSAYTKVRAVRDYLG